MATRFAPKNKLVCHIFVPLLIHSELQSECRRQTSEDRVFDWNKKHGGDYCTGEDQYQKPLLNENSAEELYKVIREGTFRM